MLPRIAIFEELALSFFLSGLTIELEKSVRVHHPTSVQDAISIARLQDEVLQVITKKFSLGKLVSLNPGTNISDSGPLSLPKIEIILLPL